MPSFPQIEWNEYKLRLIPNDTIRQNVRKNPPHWDMIPYFDGTFIKFDLLIKLPKNIKIDSLSYKWKCMTIEPKDYIKEIDGNGLIEFTKYVFPLSTKKDGLIKFDDRTYQKKEAINLGFVEHDSKYRILIEFSDNNNSKENSSVIALFKVFDRDDLKMNLIYTVITLCIAIISFLTGMWVG